jgi:hypothetical protein
LLDLRDRDHAALVLEPARRWSELVAQLAPGEPVPYDSAAAKVDEILRWRMREREQRIRFAILARAGDVHHLAAYYRQLAEAAVTRGEKTFGKVPDDAHAAVTELVRSVISIRVPGYARAVHAALRALPGTRSMFVADDDIRMLIADYSEQRGRAEAPTERSPNPSGGN